MRSRSRAIEKYYFGNHSAGNRPTAGIVNLFSKFFCHMFHLRFDDVALGFTTMLRDRNELAENIESNTS